jgi:long-chain acyl-CoA synthetase
VKSPAVAAGYYPRSDSRLQHGWFLTSDVGAFEGGELRLYGRIDNVINVRGKKVDPAEVETVVRQLAGVRDVAVVGIPDSAGAGEVVRAVVVPVAGGLDAEQVRAHCRELLADHKVPRSIVFVPDLPLTARGKLDRRALMAIGAAAEAASSS